MYILVLCSIIIVNFTKLLLSKLLKVEKLPVDLSLQLFDNLVLPVLLYGCEVWGYSDITQNCYIGNY